MNPIAPHPHPGWREVHTQLAPLYADSRRRVAQARLAGGSATPLSLSEHAAFTQEQATLIREISVLFPRAAQAVNDAAGQHEEGADTAPVSAACAEFGRLLTAVASWAERLWSTTAPVEFQTAHARLRAIPQAIVDQLSGYFALIAAAAAGTALPGQHHVNIDLNPLIEQATRALTDGGIGGAAWGWLLNAVWLGVTVLFIIGVLFSCT